MIRLYYSTIVSLVLGVAFLRQYFSLFAYLLVEAEFLPVELKLIPLYDGHCSNFSLYILNFPKSYY